MTKSLITILALIGVLFAKEPITINNVSLLKIKDGDTILFKGGNNEYNCRIYGIDTPEKFGGAKLNKDVTNAGVDNNTMKHLGRLASDNAKRLLKFNNGYKIHNYGKDRYNRYLCVVFTPENINFNSQMIKDGYAVVYKKGKYTQDKILRNEMNKAQGYAVKNKMGIWGINPNVMKSIANN